MDSCTQRRCTQTSLRWERTSGLGLCPYFLCLQPSQAGTMKFTTMISRRRNATRFVAITLRLSGQTVTRLAAQYSTVPQLPACNFPTQRISYATMDQDKATERHTKEDLLAVPVPIMTSVWTISALTHSETKSHVTTLLCILTGQYFHATDTYLSFSLLVHQS